MSTNNENPITAPILEGLHQTTPAAPPASMNCPTCGRFIDPAGNGHAPACEDGTINSAA